MKQTDLIEGIERHFLDGMQYVYCYLKGLRPHRARHTYSTFFLNSGGGLKALQEQLGHEHYRTTEIYAKSLESDSMDYSKYRKG